jgi:hypothetical protein
MKSLSSIRLWDLRENDEKVAARVQGGLRKLSGREAIVRV